MGGRKGFDRKCISSHFIIKVLFFNDIAILLSFHTMLTFLSNSSNCENENLQKSASIVTVKDNGNSSQRNMITTTEISTNNKPKGIPITSSTTIANQNKSNNAKRRKAEDKMAMIFIAIVTGWLVTNFPRICLNFQEVLNVEKQQICMEQYPGRL